ncbi:MAG: hypothetical protein GXO25_04770 [Euryarchaeota archaeon]|nr:hypothetical protein [Euryarchaeota archaeon]
MVKINMSKEEIEEIRMQFPKIDIVTMVSKHAPIFHGNVYPLDCNTKPLHDVFFYTEKNKVYVYHSGFVWVAPEDKIYSKIMEVITVTRGGKIKIEPGKKYYFGLEK